MTDGLVDSFPTVFKAAPPPAQTANSQLKVPRPRTSTPTTPPVNDRKHLTVADVCAELGISKSTFYDWRAARKAPCCIRLPNGSHRVRRAALERWLTNREESA